VTLRPASGSGLSAGTCITSGSSSSDISGFLRTRSIARLRAIAIIQVMGEAMAGSNCAAEFQTLRYVS